MRLYKLASQELGRKCRDILEIDFTGPGQEADRRIALSVPSDTPGDIQMDIVVALNQVYQAGREDCTFRNVEGT